MTTHNTSLKISCKSEIFVRAAEHMIPEYKLFVRYYEMQTISLTCTPICASACYTHIIYNSIRKFISLSTIDEYQMIHLLTAYTELMGA